MSTGATWEYKTMKLPGPPAADDATLNTPGATGWEVVSIFVWNDVRWAFMKRLAADWVKK